VGLVAFIQCKATVFIKKGHHETRRLRNKYSDNSMGVVTHLLHNIYMFMQNGYYKCRRGSVMTYTLLKWEMNDQGEWKPFRLATSPDRKVLEPMCKEHCEIIEE